MVLGFAPGVEYRHLYKHDALGRRVERTPSSGVSTNYIYDGQDVVKDLNSDGSTVEYLNGPGIDNKVRQESSATGTHYYLQDHLGSTRALTDASGNVVERVSYDSFGNGTGSARTRYAYTGRERDELTGLYYYRARWYDAQVGRFISEDPIGLAGGINFYAYVANNPVNAIDPTGEVPILVPLIAAGALILIYSEYANAPGAGSPIYHNDPKREMVGDIPYMVASGVALGKVFGLLGRGGRYCFSKFKSSEGVWTLPRKGGATIDGRWYTEHALERMAPRTPEVMAELEARALARAKAAGFQLGTPEFKAWWGEFGPNPRGVPPMVVEAEIANPGTTGVKVITGNDGRVITVIPDE